MLQSLPMSCSGREKGRFEGGGTQIFILGLPTLQRSQIHDSMQYSVSVKPTGKVF
jgi:hypothetical protein